MVFIPHGCLKPTLKGIALLHDCQAASIENAAFVAGFAVGPLAVCDEVSLSLVADIEQQCREANVPIKPHPSDDVVATMLELKRLGRACGQGFYDYELEQGQKRLWPQLGEQFNPQARAIPFEDIKERLLFIMALETVRCVEQQVIECCASANVGSVMGIGYPQWTGGTLQFINQYGLNAFIERAQSLTKLYGERFEPPALLIKMAQRGEIFQ